MRGEDANRLVQVAPELADSLRVLGLGLLLPAVGHRPQQRNQRRRARGHDPLLDAELDQGRILLERGAEEHLARQEHHHEIGTGLHVRRIAFRRELRQVCSHLLRVVGKQALARRFVGRLECLEVGVERHFRIDHDVLPAGQADDDVGAQSPLVIANERVLLFEIAMLHHPGELDDAFELQLAPSAADPRPLEGIDQPRRLAAQRLSHAVERGDFVKQLGAGLQTMALGVFDLALDLFECGLHRREQILDCALALVDVRRGLGARLAQPRFGQVEERFVVRPKSLGAERLKSVAQRASSAKPADEHTKRDPDDERANQFHVWPQYRMRVQRDIAVATPKASRYNSYAPLQSQLPRVYRETTNGSQLSGSCSSAAWMASAIARSRSPGLKSCVRSRAAIDCSA